MPICFERQREGEDSTFRSEKANLIHAQEQGSDGRVGIIRRKKRISGQKGGGYLTEKTIRQEAGNKFCKVLPRARNLIIAATKFNH